MSKQTGLKGFVALPLCVAEDSPFTRFLYFKKHVTNVESADPDIEAQKDRTLFVTNVPPEFDYSDLINVFSCFGEVEMAIMQDGSSSGQGSKRKQQSKKAAHVIFAEEESLERAVNADTSSMRQPFLKGGEPRGMDRWMAEYSKARPDPEKLQKQVDAFMQAFDERTRREKEAAQDGPVVDEDGFILVTHKKPKHRILKRAGADDATDKKKKKKKKVLHFYKFEERQQKQQQLALLRKRYQVDKKRIELMREQRKFRPFEQ